MKTSTKEERDLQSDTTQGRLLSGRVSGIFIQGTRKGHPPFVTYGESMLNLSMDPQLK
jgi:hypothetical protein